MRFCCQRGVRLLLRQGREPTKLDQRIPVRMGYLRTGKAGAGSLSAGYAPVFYVDGIRIESGNMEGGSTYQGGTALDFVNPDDIDYQTRGSISVELALPGA